MGTNPCFDYLSRKTLTQTGLKKIGRSLIEKLNGYACDPANVSKAEAIAVNDNNAMLAAPPTVDEMLQAKALLLRRIPLQQASFDDIAQGLIRRHDLGLPLDEPTLAARRYLTMTAANVQAAFRKWIRPADFVRISEGPAPK